MFSFLLVITDYCNVFLSWLIFFYCQDPKRKIHKPVKGILRLEIEKLQCGQVDEKSFENRSTNGDGRQHGYLDVHSSDAIELDRNGSLSQGLGDGDPNDVSMRVLIGLLIYAWVKSCLHSGQYTHRLFFFLVVVVVTTIMILFFCSFRLLTFG